VSNEGRDVPSHPEVLHILSYDLYLLMFPPAPVAGHREATSKDPERGRATDDSGLPTGIAEASSDSLGAWFSGPMFGLTDRVHGEMPETSLLFEVKGDSTVTTRTNTKP
jgi:hypothetical protein